MMVSAIIPSTSSITAAPRIAFPALVFSLPISRSVSTVILTEVAVRITPIKILRYITRSAAPPPSVKKYATRYPPRQGTITPISAMTREARPLFFSFWISVSSPAENIRTMTPTSERLSIMLWDSAPAKSTEERFKQAGPIMRPATSAPTTWGI